MKKDDVALTVLSVLLIISVAGLILSFPTVKKSTGTPTGYAVETTSSQVVIQNYFSIAKSTNLTSGIDFGTISSLPAVQLNATGNYNATNQSELYISVSTDSNVNIDFCIKADALNTTSGDEIGLGNYTWEDDSTTDNSTPASFGTAITTSYVTGTTGVTPGSDNYYRFWLNISAGQAPGTYNNTVSLQGVATGGSCT